MWGPYWPFELRGLDCNIPQYRKMFGLLYNLYQYVKKKNERKLTLVVLGLDGAGKTTAINTIRGELDKEVSPTFGFNAQSTEEGKYKVRVTLSGRLMCWPKRC